MSEENIMPFEFKKNESIIKVIGVGGGGGNAVNHMYEKGIHNVTFAICNTDRQALNRSPIPMKIQLGSEGLGAGNRPERARTATEESIDSIKEMLDDGSKMVFITAGMGGGTGTGAAPIIAKTAKDMDILTIGIVTIPFVFEGFPKIDQALDGVEEMSKYVDALLVINNERLRDVYPDLSVDNAFGKANDTLSIAAKSIAEIITLGGTINLDFNDVKTVLKDGGVALMSTGYGEGEGRVTKAINDALHSPLLNNNDIFNSKRILLSITYSPSCDFMMEEMNEVHEFMSRFGKNLETKWGVYIDESLENKIKFTILATGFGIESISGMERMEKKHSIEEEKRLQEEEERERIRAERRNRFYTGLNSDYQKHKYLHCYIFTQDDLDNDDIISMVETSPTYLRNQKDLDNIQSKSMYSEPVTDLPNTDDENSMTITF